MKKFLTVLLALSVVFTYTVGTAFAAMPTDPGEYSLTEAQVLENIDKAYKAALKNVEAEKEAALTDIFGKDDKGNLNKETVIYGSDIVAADANKMTVTLSAVEAVYDTMYKAALRDVEQKYDAQMSGFREAIAKVNEEAAKDNESKAYNGKFYVSGSTGTDAEWLAEGYAKYTDAWGLTATYDSATKEADYTGLFTKTAGTAGALEVSNFYADGTAVKDVANEVFDEAQNAAIDAARAVDLDAYSKEYNGKADSNYDLAVKDVTNAIKALTYISVADGTTITDAQVWANAIVAMKGVDDIYTAPVKNGNPTGYLYTGTPAGTELSISATAKITLTGLDNITKNADLPTEASKLEWAQNKVLTEVLNSINSDLAATKNALNDKIVEETLKGSNANQTVIANAKQDIEDAEEAAAAATEIVTYLVKDCDDYADLLNVNKTAFTKSTVNDTKWKYTAATDTLIANGNTYNMATAIKVIAKVADLKADAELAKKYIGIDNTTLEDIENALDTAIRKAYNGNLTVQLDVGDALETLYNYQEKLISGQNIKINDRAYNNVNSWTNNLSGIFAKEKFADVKKVAEDTKAKVRATKSIADAQAAFLEGFAAFDAIPTLADRLAAQTTKEFKNLRDSYVKDIAEYANYKANLIKASDYSWTKTTMVANLTAELDKAYTVDELKAAYTAARGEIDNLKTKVAIIDEQKALLAKIKALPTTVTIADKAAIGELKDEVTTHNDYCDLIGDPNNKIIGTNATAIVTAFNTVKQLETNNINDQHDAIWKDGKVTTDEADAVAALRKAVDEFVAYYSDPEAVSATYPVGITEKNVGDTEDALDVAQVRAFYAMVAELPADGSNVKGIEAARAAFEALSRNAKYELGAYHSNYYSKLVDMEKLIIKHVEALKITASSKAVKGKITVKWKVKGVADGAKYQVYKSTKAQSGYKFMGKTQKSYMINKKNLKKGKRYFYKVRAYIEIDGTRYYSDWSNKANRYAK